MKIFSVVLPVYQGEALLDETLAALLDMQRELPQDWQLEIIAVDDGSTDGSHACLKKWQQRHPAYLRVFKLAGNSGAMAALRAGLMQARGDAVTFAAQDLQETPQDLLTLFNAWRQHGERVQIAYRKSREEPFLKKFFARLYHWIFHTFIIRNYPNTGVATFLIDRKVADVLRAHAMSHADLATQVLSLGYSYRSHPVHRPQGKMKTLWTFSKNIKLAIDNIIAFSYFPVRLMSAAGLLVALASFLFAAYVLVGKLTGWYPINQPPGWATIIVLLSFLLGIVMIMLGIMGEYLWRILEATRRRPLYLVDEANDESDGADDGKTN